MYTTQIEQKNIISELSSDMYINSIRVEKRAPAKLPAFHEKIKAMLPRIKAMNEFNFIRVQRFHFDVSFSTPNDMKTKREALKRIISDNDGNDVFWLSVPYHPELNNTKMITRGCYKLVMEVINNSKDKLQKKPETQW